jgi:hypothetical protein
MLPFQVAFHVTRPNGFPPCGLLLPFLIFHGLSSGFDLIEIA